MPKLMIEVDSTEAFFIASQLKLRARGLSLAGETFRTSSNYCAMNRAKATAARMDQFADRLLAPFLDAKGIQGFSEEVEKP